MKHKKLLSVITTIAFLVPLIAVIQLPAFAAVEGDWTYTLYDEDTTAAITGYTGSDASITIPSKIGGKPVTRIGSGAFQDNTVVTAVVIPASVVRIEDNAFLNSTLASVNIGTGVSTIGASAFNGTALAAVTIPSNVESIGDGAFALCTNLASVTIQGNGLLTLGDGAFANTAVSAFTIPTSLASIGAYTFQNCTALSSITIPSNIVALGYGAFNGCSNLASATFEADAPTMGNFVFSSVHADFTIYYYSGATGFTTPTWTAGLETYPTVALDPPDAQAPSLSGGSVWRSDAATAQVRFSSDEAGTYYYQITNDSTAPSTDDLSGWTAGAAVTADATVTFSPAGLASGEAYLHLVVQDAAGNVSDALTAEMASNYCYFEPFEAYPLDTTIQSGAISPLTQIHNGTGDANQKVTTAVNSSSAQMLTLSSTSGNASDQIVPLNQTLLAAAYSYVFEGDVYPLGTDGWQLRFSFTNGTYEGTNEAGVFFNNGVITTATRSGAVTLQTSYTANEWHHVKITATPSTNQYAVAVDNVVLSSTLPLPTGINRLAITSGHSKTAYYDNLSFYTVADTTPPTLTKGDASRTSDTDATVTFTASEAGFYYYEVVEDGAGEPSIDTSGTGTACDTTEQTISLDTLSIGAKDLYIIAKDAASNWSDPLKIDIAPSFWTDGITATDQYPFGGGDGSTEEQAFELATPQQLAQFAYNVNTGNHYTNQYVKLTADLVLTGKEWAPIGKSYAASFNGSFQGGGHTISGLSITEPCGADSYGFFGTVGIQGVVEGLTIESGTIRFAESTGNGYFGAVAGYNLGLITGCTNKADVLLSYNSWTYAGGIAGMGNCDTSSYAWTGRIFDCHNEGDIAIGSTGSVGGIIGAQLNSTNETYLDQCSNAGSVTGGASAEAGGIAGRIGNASTIGIVNCRNIGAVTSGDSSSNQAYAGGIVGYQYYSQVKNCYNTGSITLLYNSALGNTFAGGITGYSDGATRNCYNSGTVSGTDRAGDGITGSGSSCSACFYLSGVTSSAAISGTASLTSDQMKLQASFTDWDFPDIWTINSTDNNGYPALAWQGFTHQALSSDATLSALAATGVSLSPSFDSAVTSYSANGKNSVGSVTISATPSEPSAAVAINGVAGTSKAVALSVGNNLITVEVTAPDATTTKTYTINITRASSTSSTSSHSDSPAILVTTETDGNATTNSTILTPATGAATGPVRISTDVMEALLDQAEQTAATGESDCIAVTLGTQQQLQTLEVNLLQQDLAQLADRTTASFAVNSPLVSITFDHEALQTIAGAAKDGTVVITAGRIDPEQLSKQDQEKVQGRPVYDFTVTNGSQQVSDFGEGHATVAIPYTLLPGEDPDAVVVYYLADDGTLSVVSGHYDAETACVIFETTHFSSFVIGYRPVVFADVPADAWYANAVAFLAARGITAGTGADTFSPEQPLTRAQFLVLLMNAYQIDPQTALGNADVQNFADAGNTYYTAYLLAAKSLGIAGGVGDNRFAPEQAITRQEMFVMLDRVLNLLGETPDGTRTLPIANYLDADQVAPWATEATQTLVDAAIVSGSDNLLRPESNTTRAEIAQILYHLLAN